MLISIATVALFLGTSAAIAAIWNTFFDRVPWRIVLLFVSIVSLYECTTLFSSRVDLPANLAFSAYPWKATGRLFVPANTGIVLTQLAPWTRVARDAILGGEWPLWNRYSACGAPLLANQQTAIFHPFTLLGFLPLSIGKGFTLTASMRLFTLLFFTFALLRGMAISTRAASYGAIAYAFCTFHVVWLLFPLGLATMMLPIALTGVQEVARSGRFAAFVLLAIGLTASVLGGHPESAFWVWFVAAGYSIVLMVESPKRLLIAGSGFVAAAALAAFFWMPTVALLPYVSRTAVMRSPLHNPANHNLGIEWLELLAAPNFLGTPQTGTYSPPSHRHPTVLDDYGEIASGYAGLISLALAGCAVSRIRKRETIFFAALMLFVFFTIAEIPLWRDALRALPVIGLTMHQRLRVFWAFGAAVLAAFAIDQNPSKRAVRIALAVAWLIAALVYAFRPPLSAISWITFGITTAVALVAFIIPKRAEVAAALTFIELFAVTYRYNPSAPADAVYPATGAIASMTRSNGLNRVAALGWSFLPDTPAYYALEDVKSTDPVANPLYKRLIHGFLHIAPSYDEIFTDVSEPFFDFLNIRYVYVPDDIGIHDSKFVLRYSGRDGAVYEDVRMVPRYFVPLRYRVNTAISHAIPTLKNITDFHDDAVVDHVPSKTASMAPEVVAHRVEEWKPSGPGRVTVTAYRNNSTELVVNASAWSLLCSSDTNWPGWRAYVNGERQPTVTVNGAFLGCFVPPGRSVIQFRYWPAEFDTGVRVSALALIALVAASLIRVLSSHRITDR